MVNDLVFSIAYIYALKMFAGPGSLTAMCACNGPWKTHDLTLCSFPSLPGGVNEPSVFYDC